MKITIIGAGAMGCLFSGLLTEHGQEVQLLDINPEQVETLNKNGLVILRKGVQRIVKKMQASVDPAEITRTDLIVIFVKHAQTEQAARTAAGLPGNGFVLTLQNGMGNAEIVAETVGRDRVLCGTTAQGAMRLGPGKIQHSGIGETCIGMLEQKQHPIVEDTANFFSAAGIPARGVDCIETALWNKLLVNVGINAITALTHIHNGQLLDLPETRELIQEAVHEASAVAGALAVPVLPDALAKVFAVARATASNRSSMGQDVDRQRTTEIDAINGYIVRKAEELGLEVPVNRTLTGLIKTLQGHYPAAQVK